MINDSVKIGSGVFQRFWKKHFRKGSFLRNLSIVMSGTAIAQLIGFALMPVISRLFSPTDFGVFGSYNSVLGVITAIVTLQYTQAIMLPRGKIEALNLFFAACISVAAITVLCLLTGIVAPDIIRNLIKVEAWWFVPLLAISALAFGLHQTLQAWCVRIKAFAETSRAQIVQSLASVSIWLMSGLLQAGAVGLILGSVVSQFIASLKLWNVFKKDLDQAGYFFHWHNVKATSLEYRDFPLYSAPQNLMNALSQGLPVLLLGHFYGIAIAGAYAFGMKILHLPTNFILRPLRQVLFQKASEVDNLGQDIQPLFVKSTCGLMLLAALPTIIIFVWAPRFFPWIFGKEWLTAGIYVRWLILWIFISFSNVPAVLFARILRQQRNLFFFECLILSSRTIILVAGGIYWDALRTIIAFSILGFLLNLTLILWIWVLVCRRTVIKADNGI
ncbi:MAG: lipopolysaccharide biosynthesis protein [Syntrophotalea sp.]|uniref:lipopolysaccharide biosynthesis protein n=1 Tax=Syntrophotalea sp. TaxID=2812029 RepID=UPI003D128B80